jgi:hypothetical protein
MNATIEAINRDLVLLGEQLGILTKVHVRFASDSMPNMMFRPLIAHVGRLAKTLSTAIQHSEPWNDTYPPITAERSQKLCQVLDLAAREIL